MIGGQIAKVIDSKHPKFPKGSYVFGQFGWRSHTIVDPDKLEMPNYYVLPSFGSYSRSLGLGYLGMPGNCAYFGFLEICQPKQGDVVVISAAAGAVGSLVGQIAKIKGCTVIGFAGTDEKCNWLKKDLGFDHAINYKKGKLSEELKKAAPNGIDCYFDNVGGPITSVVISQMKVFGRISVCGSVSFYNNNPNDCPKDFHLQRSFVWQQLKMEGFQIWRWSDRWFEGINQIHEWIKEGKVKYHETVTEGFEKMPETFIKMLQGDNVGKAIIKV